MQSDTNTNVKLKQENKHDKLRFLIISSITCLSKQPSWQGLVQHSEVMNKYLIVIIAVKSLNDLHKLPTIHDYILFLTLSYLGFLQCTIFSPKIIKVLNNKALHS